MEDEEFDEGFRIDDDDFVYRRRRSNLYGMSDDYDYDDIDWRSEGCGEDWSCSECDNFGCSAHPLN